MPESNKDVATSDVTLQLKKVRSGEDKENEKDNDRSGSQATQALIQRRRRPKRRSTGVCNVGGEVSSLTHKTNNRLSENKK